MTLLDQSNSFCNFGIAAGLLMAIGLSVVAFFMWIDRETKPQ